MKKAQRKQASEKGANEAWGRQWWEFHTRPRSEYAEWHSCERAGEICPLAEWLKGELWGGVLNSHFDLKNYVISISDYSF